MSTLSLPSGSYRSPASVALTTRLQRAVFRTLHAVGSVAVAAVNGLERRFTLPEAAEPTNAQELLEYAGRFERTQPSYAADLRAAALQHMRQTQD
jgi:hypothetical protein